MASQDEGRAMPDFNSYPALGDLAGLWLAASPTDLWRQLVWGGGMPPSANSWDAAALFRRLHGEGQPGGLDTALLLCTDPRWSLATGRLVDEIANSGILSDDQLVALAERFLEVQCRWALPEELAAGPWMDIVLSDDDEDASQDDASAEIASQDHAAPEPDPEASAPEGPLLIARTLRPPLRRWAAATILRQDAGRLSWLLGQTKKLGARDADSAVAGIIDARDCFNGRRAAAVMGLGLTWTVAWVRLLALQALADREGLEVAHQRAAVDPSAKVRAWAERRPPSSKPEPQPADQPALFEL